MSCVDLRVHAHEKIVLPTCTRIQHSSAAGLGYNHEAITQTIETTPLFMCVTLYLYVDLRRCSVSHSFTVSAEHSEQPLGTYRSTSLKSHFSSSTEWWDGRS